MFQKLKSNKLLLLFISTSIFLYAGIFYLINPKIKKQFIQEKILFTIQHTPQINLSWNNYYHLTGLSNQFFDYIRFLFKKNKDLQKIQLISAQKVILFDSDELIYGKYELSQPRKIKDSLLLKKLDHDSIQYDFIQIKLLTAQNYKEGRFLEVIVPFHDPILGKVSSLRMIFSLKSFYQYFMKELTPFFIFIFLFIILGLVMFHISQKEIFQLEKQIRNIINQYKREENNIPYQVHQYKTPLLNEFSSILKEILDKIQWAKQHNEALYSFSPLPILFFDQDANITDCNESFKITIGMNNCSSLKLTTIFDNINMSEIKQFFNSFQSSPYISLPVMDKKHQKNYSLIIKPINEEHIQSYVGYLFDRSSLSSEEFYNRIGYSHLFETLIDKYGIGIIICDQNFKINYFYGDLITQLTDENINPIMDSVFSIIPGLKMFKDSFIKLLNHDIQKFSFDFETNYRLLQGFVFLHEISGIQHFAIVIKPVPDKLSEISVKEFELRAISVLKTLNQWMHFLSEILTMIKIVYSSLAKGNKDEHYHKNINHSLNTEIENIYQRLKELSLLNLEHLQLVPYNDHIEIHDLINKAISQFYPLSIEKKQKIIIHPHSEKIYFYSNEKHLLFAIKEIIKNALEASKEESQSIDIFITLIPDASSSSKKAIQIKVADKGYGIPYEFQDKIFEPFYSKSKTKPFSGLGLFFAKSIVKIYHGSIVFKSIEGKGSIFYIILPMENEKTNICL